MNASPEAIFAYVSVPEKWPQWATFVKRASSEGSGKTHWVYEMGGMKVESDTEETEVIPNHVYAFRQLKGFLREGSFRVQIEPVAENSKNSLIRLTFEYEPPYSYLGKLVDKLGISERAKKDVDSSLQSLKRLVET